MQFCAAAVIPSAVQAQVLDLRLRDSLTRVPVAGAIVRLLHNDSTVGQALSSVAGRITFPVPAPGAYRVRIDRIGFAGTVAGPFQVGERDTLRRNLLLAGIPNTLPSIIVQGETRCGSDLLAGHAAAALWEEVRKALTATTLSEDTWDAPLHYRTF